MAIESMHADVFLTWNRSPVFSMQIPGRNLMPCSSNVRLGSTKVSGGPSDCCHMQEARQKCLVTLIRLMLDRKSILELRGASNPLAQLCRLLSLSDKLRASARDSGILVILMERLCSDDCTQLDQVRPWCYSLPAH